MVTYPSDWQEIKIGDTGRVITGSTPSTNNKYYWGKEYTWITPTDIDDRVFMYSSERKLSKQGFEISRQLPPGSVLITCIASIGKNCILGAVGSCNQQINAIIPSEEYDSRYIYYLMNFSKDTLENLAGITATKILNKKTFETIKLCVPELSEQQAIASVLSDFDEHIDNLTELIEKKKAIRDGTLEDLLSGRTRLDGFDGEWEEKSFKDLGDTLTGLTYSPDNIRPSGKLVIRSSNVQDDRLSFEDNVFVDRTCVISEDIKKGDIIICVRNGSASLIGKSAYASSDLDATFGAFMSNFRCKNHDSSGFVYYFTKSAMFKNFVKQILGATINQITKTDLKRVTLNIPVDIEEQQAIASVLTAMDEEIESLKIEKDKMIQIKEGAMDDLLTGRVRLKA